MCPYSLSLFHSLRLSASQLRSAGAGIIQDLFPRVSCISTLDISDNGETSNCINERKLLSAPTDLQSVSLPSVASVVFDSACTFLCSFSGLDADLLCVIPAFSRHPSLKHLLLGKNFNIKGRYLFLDRERQTSQSRQ